MGNFFNNNKTGLIGALIVGLVATFFTGGLGIPALLAAGAAFLVGNMFGDQEGGLLSGLLGDKKPETTAPPAASDEISTDITRSTAVQRGTDEPATTPPTATPPAPKADALTSAVITATKTPAVTEEPQIKEPATPPAEMTQPYPVLNADNTPRIRQPDDPNSMTAFAISTNGEKDDKGNPIPTHAVVADLTDDHSHLIVSRVVKLEQDGQPSDKFLWDAVLDKTGPATLPVQGGNVDFDHPEFQGAMAYINAKIEYFEAYNKPHELSFTHDAETDMLKTTVGEVVHDDNGTPKLYNVILLGAEGKDEKTDQKTVQLRTLMFEDDMGEKLRAANGMPIGVAVAANGDEMPKIPLNDGKFTSIAGWVEDRRKYAEHHILASLKVDRENAKETGLTNRHGEPLNAAADGSQYIVIDVPGSNKDNMSAIAANVLGTGMITTDGEAFGKKGELNVVDEFVAQKGDNADMQIVLRGKQSTDGEGFIISERHLLLTSPDGENTYISKAGGAGMGIRDNGIGKIFDDPIEVSSSAPISLSGLSSPLNTPSDGIPVSLEAAKRVVDELPHSKMGEISTRVRSSLPLKITQTLRQFEEQRDKGADALTVTHADTTQPKTPQDDLAEALRKFQEKDVLAKSTIPPDEIEVPQLPNNPEGPAIKDKTNGLA